MLRKRKAKRENSNIELIRKLGGKKLPITVRKYAFLQLRLDSDVISYSNLSFFPAKTPAPSKAAQ